MFEPPGARHPVLGRLPFSALLAGARALWGSRALAADAKAPPGDALTPTGSPPPCPHGALPAPSPRFEVIVLGPIHPGRPSFVLCRAGWLAGGPALSVWLFANLSYHASCFGWLALGPRRRPPRSMTTGSGRAVRGSIGFVARNRRRPRAGRSFSFPIILASIPAISRFARAQCHAIPQPTRPSIPIPCWAWDGSSLPRPPVRPPARPSARPTALSEPVCLSQGLTLQSGELAGRQGDEGARPSWNPLVSWWNPPAGAAVPPRLQQRNPRNWSLQNTRTGRRHQERDGALLLRSDRLPKGSKAQAPPARPLARRRLCPARKPKSKAGDAA